MYSLDKSSESDEFIRRWLAAFQTIPCWATILGRVDFSFRAQPAAKTKIVSGNADEHQGDDY
jgi:hypothetical protein